MNGKDTIDGLQQEGENFDLPEYFRPIAAKYGREMFSLVMNAGIASQAAAHAMQDAHALRLLITSYNQLSNMYVQGKGWDERTLAECSSAIQLAFARQIQIATPELILPEDLH